MGMRPVIRIERGDSDDRFRDKVNRNFMTLAQEARLGADTKRNALIEDVNEYTDDVVAPVSEFSMEAAALAADALAAAGEASAKAGLKNAIYWQATPPAAPAEGHKVGDIWFDTSYDSGGIVKNAVNKWTGSAWELQPLSDSAIGNLSAGKITAGVVNVAITLNAATINGGLITGSTLQTAGPGTARVVLSGAANEPGYGYCWVNFETDEYIGFDRDTARIAGTSELLEPGVAVGQLYLSSPQYNGSPIASVTLTSGSGGLAYSDIQLNSAGGGVTVYPKSTSNYLNSAFIGTDANYHTVLKLGNAIYPGKPAGASGGGVTLKGLNSSKVLQVRNYDDSLYGDVHAGTLFALTSLRTDSYLQMKEQGGTNSVRNMYLWTDGTTWQLRFFVGAALKKLTFTA